MFARWRTLSNMDFLLVVWEKLVVHWANLGISMGGGVLLGWARKRWGSVVAPALYAIGGGGVVFACLTLLSQSNQQAEEVQIDRSGPPRPYFTYIGSMVGKDERKDSPDAGVLLVSLVNNDIPVKDVVSQILVLKEPLDPTRGPVHTRRVEQANPIGPHGSLNHRAPVPIAPNTPELFVAFQLQYTDIFSDTSHSQDLFLVFTGVEPDGSFVPQLFNISTQQKESIEQYMVDSRIPRLELK